MLSLSDFDANGYVIIDNMYSQTEVDALLSLVAQVSVERETFRKSTDLFAIRQFLKEVPGSFDLILNDKLKLLLASLPGEKYFVVKSIYFDKPPASNWFVSYHQDLTISVDKKIELPGFECWTNKQDQFAVQPPVDILESIVTVRIHLDDTNENNGALKVVPQSHLRGISRPAAINWSIEKEAYVPVKKGGAMLMKPLLMHSSGRTTNGRQRRVIHLEFSNRELPDGLHWAERMDSYE